MESPKQDAMADKTVRSVTIASIGDSKKIELTSGRKEAFLKELARVMKSATPAKGPVKVGPGCKIIVTYDDNSTKVYHLLSRSVLYDTERDHYWQFYMAGLSQIVRNKKPSAEDRQGMKTKGVPLILEGNAVSPRK